MISNFCSFYCIAIKHSFSEYLISCTKLHQVILSHWKQIHKKDEQPYPWNMSITMSFSLFSFITSKFIMIICSMTTLKCIQIQVRGKKPLQKSLICYKFCHNYNHSICAVLVNTTTSKKIWFLNILKNLGTHISVNQIFQVKHRACKYQTQNYWE